MKKYVFVIEYVGTVLRDEQWATGGQLRAALTVAFGTSDFRVANVTDEIGILREVHERLGDVLEYVEKAPEEDT